jgi:multidrug efflux system membrane fusion protein
VRPGHQVKKGDLLFKLDPRSFKSSLSQAEASLSSNQAQLRRAQQDLNRYKTLSSQNFLSQQQYEQSQAEVETLQAAIAQYQAIRENAALQLSHTTITAPINGRTGEVLVDPGNNIKANDSTLLVINTISPADVRFSVPERFLPELNRRFRSAPVEVNVLPEGDRGEPISGVLTVIDNAVDRNTGAISMRARFANKDERLWPGQFVRVNIVMDSIPDALIIPEGAILEGIYSRYVYVLQEDGRVVNRDISAVDLAGGMCMVTAGLSPGELVIIDGQLNLMPGSLAEAIASSSGTGNEGPDMPAEASKQGPDKAS